MSSLKKVALWILFFLAIVVAIIACIFQVRYGNKDSMPCVFCDIVNKTRDADMLYMDEDFIAFKDIKPATSNHFLIIPKRHIANTNSLTIADKDMIVKMKLIMLELLKKHNQTIENEISLGFHVPPFNSIKHLHLHGISPKSEMKLIGRWIFKEDSYWYKSVDTIIASLIENS
ncbi:CLUMA_CG017906, isoform A [Clunio marinus]|uniref:Adenosine 5'-monophosphoramidase HINT3 n=1 Tax=Clunio marinus TaxID=568069 RepID=A0A1J1IXC5_9DIPT|nr:CLUMA_CG017906, isoform A [Clunio marinus]